MLRFLCFLFFDLSLYFFCLLKVSLWCIIIYFCFLSFFSLSLSLLWGSLGYPFGCHLMYGLIPLSLWICVLLILVRVCVSFLLFSWVLLLYNLLASLPLLVDILFIYSSLGSLCLLLLYGNDVLVDGLFYICIVLAYLVKMPIFIGHLRLPKAHFEAPVVGSMIFAGVSLKLGGYELLLLLLLIIIIILLLLLPLLLLYCVGLGLVWYYLGCFEFGWWSFCQFVFYMADWFEVIDYLFFCSSYEWLLVVL